MTPRDDYPSEMPEPVVDDAAAEALLTGRWQGDGELAAVSGFLGALRATAQDPAPPPSPALAAVLAGGLPDGVAAPPPPVTRRHRSTWARRVRAAALGLGMAATGLTGAAAAGVLPDALQRAVGSVVETVTPFSVPKPAGDDTRILHRPPVGTPSTSLRPGTPAKDGGQPPASPAANGTAATVPGGGPASTASAGPGTGGTTVPAGPAGTSTGSGAVPPGGPAPGTPGATVPSPNVTVPPPSLPPLGPATPTVPSVPTTLPVAPGDLPTTTPTTVGVHLP